MMTPRPDAGRPDFIEAVFTCRGNFYDPNFPNELEILNRRLQTLLKADDDNLVIKKVEPWNSVKVTVNIPKEAAERLKALAQQNDGAALRNLGIMSLQMQGDRIISLTLKSPARAVKVSQDNAAAATANAQSSLPSACSSSASDSRPTNLLNLTTDSHNKLHMDKNAAPVQPPVDRVPPLVLNKAKLEKRQRKPANSKSRSCKSKSSSSPSSTNVSQSAPPVTTFTPTPSAASAAAMAVMHPALKDTELPLSSDFTDQETVNGLLTTLFKRSLDPNQKSSSKSLTSSLPPQSAKKRRQLHHPEQLLATTPSSGSSPFLSSAAVSSMAATSFLSRPIAASTADTHPKSEHVSVIARAQAPTSDVQTEAMDLSGPGYARLSKPESPAVPMDLSAASSIQPTPITTTTLSHNHNNNSSRQTHEKLADPPDSQGLTASSAAEGTTSTQTSEIDKSPAQLSGTKANSVIDDSTPTQCTPTALDSTWQATPTESSQPLVAGSTSSYIADIDGGCRQSSTSHNSGVTNGLGLDNTKVSLEDNSSSQTVVVHGRPVSVICSPLDDRTKSNSTSSEPSRDEHESLAVNTANKQLEDSPLAPADTVIARPPTSETNGSNFQLSKDSICSNTDDITESLRVKYDGPTPQHLSAMDHEPTENGSSTSTDSGVVAGSPKSDICATPPAVEEQHKVKSEASNSTSPVLTHTLPVPSVANDLLAHPTVATLDSSTRHVGASRPSVSILKPVRAHMAPRPSNEVKGAALLTPGVSIVRPTNPSQPSATQRPVQLHHTQAASDLNYRTTAHDSTSEVFLAAASTVSHVPPIRVTLSTRERSVSQPSFTATQKVQAVVSTPLYASDIQPRKVVLAPSPNKHVGNSEQEDLRASNSKHRIVHELKGKIGVSPANASMVERQHANNLHLSASLLKERIITPVMNAKSQPVRGPVDAKVSPHTVLVDTSSNTTTVIVSPRTGSSLPLTSSADASHLNCTLTTAHNLTLATKLKPNPTQKNIPASKPTTLNAASGGSMPVSNANFTSNNSHPSHRQEDHHYSLRASDRVDIHPQEQHGAYKLDSALDSTVGQHMVNGTSECGESECTDVIASSEAMSPESFTSGSASLEVDIPGTEAASLISPGQQRKSGRVRTPKSPDPDYITPTTKARKRSSRPTSEGSNNSDVAGPTKKVSKLPVNMVQTLAEEPNNEPPPAFQVNPSAQMNGPTSQAKRSTRSSGLSDLQALPTVYRERKRSKR